ncbi:UPF0014-domain-containing protein [Russula emetica]|nr:UPF0014-domain-containing protein [Russula emetica]
MDQLPSHPVADLGWSQVGFGLTFIAFNSLISQALQLGIGASPVFAALRCVVQLTLAATILQRVFAANNFWAVVGIALLLNLLCTIEIVVIKAGRRCGNMFGPVLIAMLTSTIPVSILGAQFAMRVFPFWTPEQYIPVVGMLCGNAIGGVLVSQSFILKELDENHDKTETLLAFGASRFEACRPLAIESLRLALMPTINRMSVMGVISIPGMMTGAILGGADVGQAARLQMIIMFMISASSVLACVIVTLFTLHVCVDSEQRIRKDRIHKRPHAFRRASSDGIRAVIGSVRRAWILFTGSVKQLIVNDRIEGIDSRSERAPLLP